MDLVAIIETALKAILGYGVLFCLILLLSLPFMYSVLIYERIKQRRLVTNERLLNPTEDESQNRFRFLEDIRKSQNQGSVKDNLTRLRNEIYQERRHINLQREEIRKLSEVNQQLMSIVIKIRDDLRDD